MTTSAMLWEGASYNNGILPFKKGVLGESYNSEGEAREIHAPMTLSEEAKKKRCIRKINSTSAVGGS